MSRSSASPFWEVQTPACKHAGVTCMNVHGTSTPRKKAYLQCLGFFWDAYIHFPISLSFLWKCLYVVEMHSWKITEGLIAGMLFMPENEINRETGKYVIFLDKAKAARKEVLDFKSLDTWSWTKQICMCKRYLKEICLLIANFLFLCYQCTFQLEITRSWL